MREDSAEQQALDYLLGGDVAEREHPRYILTSDFARIRLTDLEAPTGEQTVEIVLTDLASNVERFTWIAGYTARSYSTVEAETASVKAADLMANLYVALAGDLDEDITERAEDEDDTSQEVSILMTRLLFLMYGDDAGLWEKGLFHEFLRTRTDAADLGGQLNTLFDVLNTREDRRSRRTPEEMAAFPYVNGALYAGRQMTLHFDEEMRDALLKASAFDWSAISPAVFGSLFQAIKSREARRDGGEHYTTEENILKTLQPLFLDEIRADLKKAWNSAHRLRALHARFADMRYLDPACGCGNFLIVAYREMRKIELELLVRLRTLEGIDAHLTLDGTWDLKVSLDQFHGIEINWWPAKIAETAMFLVDHQANRDMALALGQAPDRLPITITAHIHHANALRVDWSAELFPPTDSTFVFGNPPFLGQYTRAAEQVDDLKAAWGAHYNGYLDFVTGWHAKTIEFLGQRNAQWAFVTTNSIVQGDPVPALFAPIFEAGWRIKFAHRTFAWTSEATGKAAVHCTIVGFDRLPSAKSRLFDYATPSATPHEGSVASINAYLVDGPNVLVRSVSKPISSALPPVQYGSKPADGGFLLLNADDRDQILTDASAAKYLRRFKGASELVRNVDRWCLWLADLDPTDLSKSPVLRQRLESVREFRSNSKKAQTQAAATTPHLFVERRQPSEPYLCIPRHVSEARHYFTAARFEADVIAGDANFTAIDSDGFLFAIISSSMFITWQRTVGGRIKSDLRFSNTVVWNSLPLPVLEPALRAKIIKAGEGVLAARAEHPERSLADHYNPLAMSPALVTAHTRLDAVVDRAFGSNRTCTSEAERQKVLFARYEEMTRSTG